MSALNPLQPLLGGALIGTAAGGFLLFDGRIAGVSGLLASATGLTPYGPPRALAAGFLGGLIVAATLLTALFPRDDFSITASAPLIVVGGLLVGLGTRLGSGCTSGHGVCGLARLSRRSIAATATFMAAAAVTVFVARHVVGG